MDMDIEYFHISKRKASWARCDEALYKMKEQGLAEVSDAEHLVQY